MCKWPVKSELIYFAHVQASAITDGELSSLNEPSTKSLSSHLQQVALGVTKQVFSAVGSTEFWKQGVRLVLGNIIPLLYVNPFV